ncbi:WD40 repeat-like protein [Trichoderma chlorosporum]
MADSESHYAFDDGPDDEQSIISTRGLEAFSRKVTVTASQLMGPAAEASGAHYRAALAEVHKQMKRPSVQRGMFSMARSSPTEIVRSKLSTTEIQHRALTHLPDELLSNIPEHQNAYSLFQGFQASFPELANDSKKHRRRPSRGRKLLEEGENTPATPSKLAQLKKEKTSMVHELELLGVRKSMVSCEIREIDNKIANLYGMRRIVLERLAGFEQDEATLEHDVMDLELKIDEVQSIVDEAEEIARNTATKDERDLVGDADDHDPEFMTKSVYEKLPAADSKQRKAKKVHRRKSMPILHEHFAPGSNIREIRAHRDTITAMDFDAPFGTLVTAALDDTVRVWDLNAGRCMGYLEGHTASVRALQVEDNILATGSMDATIRLWDLSKTHYNPQGGKDAGDDDEDAIAFEHPDAQPIEPPEGSMDDCALFTLSSHVDEITALHFRGDVMVSGSADKTIRHWDLEKGRCVQTLDVMWAAAQASAIATADDTWRPTGRAQGTTADFVGALQVFESALACGTADGMVRLWDLRSGQVHRSLVGHTGAVTCLQFDDMHLVTGSLDRSIRIWDLRTGSIYDAYAYDNPVTSMMFDARRIVSAASEDVVKVYDKVEGRQWDCGAGIAASEGAKNAAIVERVRVKDGYLPSQPADVDLKALAMQQLLHRQARLLIELHESLQKNTEAGVDEDLLQTRLDDLASVCMTALYAYRFDLLPYHWRWIYTDTLILISYYAVLQAARRGLFDGNVMDRVVESLDRALIVAGGAGKPLGKQWIEKTLDLLDLFWKEMEAVDEEARRPQKRMKRESAFSAHEPFGRPSLSAERTCPRYENWTLERFDNYMNGESRGRPLPIVFTDLTRDWPAFSDMPWNSPEYLLSRTFGGRRLVPVEVGRSYVDEGWSQELIQFKHFLAKYIDPSISTSSDEILRPEKVGYLAQHNLFQQIPALRNDIQVPDFCWADVPPHPTDAAKNQAPVGVPQLNAWFGPAKTITPLHTDGYHNLLCQVVGTKYVRLYSPEETKRLRPRGMEHGVDMSNTSELDIGVLEGWDDEDNEDGVKEWDSIRKELKDVPYWEAILGPGDTLVIPIGWWHYVRSLSISFSVSFWWN